MFCSMIIEMLVSSSSNFLTLIMMTYWQQKFGFHLPSYANKTWGGLFSHFLVV